MAILIVLSVALGVIAIKKFNKTNKSDIGIQSSNPGSGQYNNQENQKNKQESSENQQNSVNSVTCPECGGTGSIVCPTCHGHGLYYICGECQAKFYTYLNRCSRCGERNTLIQHVCPTRVKCPQCSGSG